MNPGVGILGSVSEHDGGIIVQLASKHEEGETEAAACSAEDET